jgi:hypothetical protein
MLLPTNALMMLQQKIENNGLHCIYWHLFTLIGSPIERKVQEGVGHSWVGQLKRS